MQCAVTCFIKVILYVIWFAFIYSVLRLDNDGHVQVVLTSNSSHRTAPSSLTNATTSSTPIGHLFFSSSPALPDAPPTTPASSAGRIYTAASQKGFLDGVFGCLRPVLSFIGKATAAELKQQGQSLHCLKKNQTPATFCNNSNSPG